MSVERILVLKAIFLLATLMGLFTVIKFWNVPADHSSYSARSWWGGDSWGRGYRRAWLPLVAGVAFLTVGLFFPSLALVAVIAAFLVAAPLAAAIFLFNRPKLLVPPGARHEKGVLSEFLKSRR